MSCCPFSGHGAAYTGLLPKVHSKARVPPDQVVEALSAIKYIGARTISCAIYIPCSTSSFELREEALRRGLFAHVSKSAPAAPIRVHGGAAERSHEHTDCYDPNDAGVLVAGPIAD